jgi:hypothetical protein
MDENVIFNIMDILLERHRQVVQIEQPRSMMIQAKKIVFTADENIRKWMELNKVTE